MKAALEGTT